MTTKNFKVEPEPRPSRRNARKLRPYLSKSVAVGLRPAAELLDAVGQNDDDPDLRRVAMWLRENAYWYFDSGER